MARIAPIREIIRIKLLMRTPNDRHKTAIRAQRDPAHIFAAR
jgi:hypothetical protein